MYICFKNIHKSVYIHIFKSYSIYLEGVPICLFVVVMSMSLDRSSGRQIELLKPMNLVREKYSQSPSSPMQENIKTTLRAKETQQAAGDRAPSRPSLKGAQAAATALDHVRSGVLLHPRQAWLPHWAVFLSLIYLPPHMACMQDLSSPTRDQTCSLVMEALSPNHWSTREVQLCSFNIFFCTRV